MHKFEGRVSLTKNWPGGRKKAVVIVPTIGEGSVPDWNREVAAFTRPYWPAKDKQDPVVEAAFAGLEPGSKAELSGFQEESGLNGMKINVTKGAPPGTVAIVG